MVKAIRYACFLFLSVFFLLEIALRIYNPFHLRLKGDRIMLPIDQRLTITNRINPKLDSLIINTRNSLGFRGSEPPADWKHTLTLITIGGSTTECHFLSDDHTWPELLGKMLADSFAPCWLNNAGLDGHSTYGHEVLLDDYVKKLHPSVVLFLCGINDVEATRPSFHDKLYTRGAYPDLKHYLFENSEVLNLALNLVRGWRAQKFNNTTNAMMVLDPRRRLVLPASVMRHRLDAQQPYLLAFRTRLEGLADTCTQWGILPVFLTQPNLFGFGVDSLTGADLAAYPLEDSINGQLMWQMLEKYNQVTRDLCLEKGLPLIDLGRLMPKNSLYYYYDMSHFTNAGAMRMASLLAPALDSILDCQFPVYRR